MAVNQKQFWILSAFIAIVNTEQLQGDLLYKVKGDALINASSIFSRCSSEIDCRHTEICLHGLCECNVPYALYDPNTESCIECAYEGRECTTCCISPETECFDSVCRKCFNDDGDFICDRPKVFFATASQIALSVAMVLGILILLSMLYRICTKPHYLATQVRRRSNDGSSAEISRGAAIRVSLSSIQIRVLARLQHRPPQYETQTEYDNRTSERIDVERHLSLTTTSNTVQGEAPPSYDITRDQSSLGELPPPYSIAVISPTIECTGNVNEAFTSEETDNELVSNHINNGNSSNTNISEQNQDSLKCDSFIVIDKIIGTDKNLHM